MSFLYWPGGLRLLITAGLFTVTPKFPNKSFSTKQISQQCLALQSLETEGLAEHSILKIVSSK